VRENISIGEDKTIKREKKKTKKKEKRKRNH
jgi:hypothetical protein